MYEESQSDECGPRGTFESYRAEGDNLFKNNEFKKAIEVYSTALELKPGDKTCLVARSRCQLLLGDNTAALIDADSSLAEDPEYHKGLYQKAEALYSQGEFELALVFYHRGHKLRSEQQEFRLGIQKAQEAIDNSVGSPATVHLTTEGDLSFFKKQDEVKPKKKSTSYKKASLIKKDSIKPPPRNRCSDKTIKQMLGELYGDKIYLEKLLDETDRNSDSGRNIYYLVCDGLHYLDTRTEFWRQQKPMYSRKRDKAIIARRRKTTHIINNDINKYIIHELEKIDDAQAYGNFTASLKKAKKVLKAVEDAPVNTINNRMDIIANLNSLIGNAYLEEGQYELALHHHEIDLEVAKNNDLEEALSRARDNLGRVYARVGKFQLAIDSWTSKISLSKSALETTWLFHEIGRCYLELQSYKTAKHYGEKSLVAAMEAKDRMWQLNAMVLISQAEVKLGYFEMALQSFDKALDISKLHGDEAAEAAIKRAIVDVNSKIVNNLKQKEEDGGGEFDGDTTEEGNDLTPGDDTNRPDMSGTEAEGDETNRIERSETEGDDTNRIETSRTEGDDTNRIETSRTEGDDTNRIETSGTEGDDRNRIETTGTEGDDTNRIETSGTEGDVTSRIETSGTEGKSDAV